MTDIAGLYPAAFVGIVVAVGIVLCVIIWLWNNQRVRGKFSEQTRGKLLCEFCSPEGAFEELCDVNKGMVRKMEHATRGTFSSDRWVKAPGVMSNSLKSILCCKTIAIQYAGLRADLILNRQ